MTLPDERYRAIMWGKQLLEDIASPHKTKRVPKEIRDRARSALRHFPEDYYLSMLAEARPDILERQGEPFDPLYKLVKEYGMDKDAKGS